MADNQTDDNIALDSGTYEIIQSRLLKQKNDLQNRLHRLNEARKTVFGSLETQLIANDRINTEHNCIARDIVSIGNQSLFGYNVHFGLRTSISLSDVFSVYQFQRHEDALRFEESPTGLQIIDDPVFKNDFENLYKYYQMLQSNFHNITLFCEVSKILDYQLYTNNPVSMVVAHSFEFDS